MPKSISDDSSPIFKIITPDLIRPRRITLLERKISERWLLMFCEFRDSLNGSGRATLGNNA